MAEYREYISALKQCAKEHENENLFTGQIDTTALCNDTAKLLENDVIERSKIDKAIEDMEFNIKCNTDQRTGRANLLGQGQMMMLDILKKYIGE